MSLISELLERTAAATTMPGVGSTLSSGSSTKLQLSFTEVSKEVSITALSEIYRAYYGRSTPAEIKAFYKKTGLAYLWSSDPPEPTPTEVVPPEWGEVGY